MSVIAAILCRRQVLDFKSSLGLVGAQKSHALATS